MHATYSAAYDAAFLGDAQQEMKRYRDADSIARLAADGGRVAEAALRRAMRLSVYSNDVDSEELSQPETLSQDRQSDNHIRARKGALDNEDELEMARRVIKDYEDIAEKSRRRTPVDPTLLMMGIGRRK